VFNTANQYGSVAKFFHWTLFFLVTLMLVGGYFLEDIPKDWQRVAYNTHKLIGLLILCLMLFRLGWALSNMKPTLQDTKPWEKLAERLVHWSLYASLIAMPLLGWIGATASGRPPKLGTWIIALPIVENKALKEWAFNGHIFVSYLIIGLLCIHISAALLHHFVRKDNVLQRMMPEGWV